VNSGAPEGLVVPAPLVTPVVLIWLNTSPKHNKYIFGDVRGLFIRVRVVFVLSQYEITKKIEYNPCIYVLFLYTETEAISISLTHIYMMVLFADLRQAH
jgi:hypothetical protein